MKKFLALLLSVLMVGSVAAFAADDVMPIAADPATAEPVDVATDTAGTPEVVLRIEGAEKTLLEAIVELDENDTALTVLERALAAAKLTCTVKDSQYGGKYVSEIAGETEATFGGYDGWLYYVNGVAPTDTMDVHALADGDVLLLVYGNYDILNAIVTSSRKGAAAYITVTAEVTTYDADWNPTTTVQPVAGVTVAVEGGETYVTDEKGVAALNETDSAKEAVTVSVSKYAENKLPLIIRGTGTLSLLPTFTDVKAEDWFASPVTALAMKGIVSGYSDGSFGPSDSVSRAMAVTMLWRAAGSPVVNFALDFSDVAEGQWYTEAVRWAASLEITKGVGNGKFGTTTPVTRQDLAVMIVKANEAALKKELKSDAEAPAFPDNDQIASYAAESVYTLQKAGIVSGNSAGEFQPTGTASRAVFSKMLAGVLGL